MVKERLLTFLSKFEIYEDGRYLGCIRRELTVFKPKYNIDYLDWHVKGNLVQWDYEIFGPGGEAIAQISKQFFHLTDTYMLDIADPSYALYVLMFVLAMDAEKCTKEQVQ